MTEVVATSTNVDVLAGAEPAIVAGVRTALGTRQHPDGGGRVDRLDLLGNLLAPETATLAVLWLASTRRASTATRRGYADDLIQWARWYAGERGGRLDLAALTRADVTLWLAAAQAAGHRPATISRRLSTLSSLYRYAASHGIPVVCPITEDHRPRVQRGRTDRSARVLGPDQLRALAAAARAGDVRDALVVTLLTTDGVRVSELCGVDDADVVADGRAWLYVTRKGGARARVALDPTAVALIERYQAERPEATDGQPLLRDATGARLDRHDVTRMLRRLARAAGIPDPGTVTPHSLRASAITALADAGTPVQHIQTWAGHAHVTTTMGYVGSRGQDARHAAMTAQLAALVADQ